jgi:hypothetical protein
MRHKKYRTKKWFRNSWKKELTKRNRRTEDDFHKKKKIEKHEQGYDLAEFYKPDDGTLWSKPLIYQLSMEYA